MGIIIQINPEDVLVVHNNYIKIAAATPKIEVANCSYNADKIIELMKKANNQQVQLLCLPELCITGSTCGDLFLQSTLINSAKEALLKLINTSRHFDMTVAVGLPINCNGSLYNAVAVFSYGKILGLVPKVSKHFAAPPNEKTIHFNGGEISFATDAQFTTVNKITFAIDAKDDSQPCAPIILNPSATPEIVGSAHFRRDIARQKSQPGIYVQANAGYGESTTDMVFSGHNIIAANGNVLQESPPFGDGFAVTEVFLPEKIQLVRKSDQLNYNFFQPSTSPHPFIAQCKNPEEALNIQAAGLAKRIATTKSQTAVIGISGGLDSCLALLVSIRAFKMLNKPLSQISAITLPCFGTSAHTKSNAHSLCTAFGIICREIDITPSVTQHLQDIGHPQCTYDIVFENAQARMRTMLLMNVANQEHGIVVGTGSLSELALGWATYNGDHMSMYAVNAGVPKTLVRKLVEHIAENLQFLNPCQDNPLRLQEQKKVLHRILATKVSPELLPTEQNTEELVGPYELHDFFIYHMLGRHQTPTAIFELAKNAFEGKYDEAEILHWLKTFYERFFSQQFKRNCLPDAPQVVTVSLSPRKGLHMPSDAAVHGWLAELSSLSPLQT